MVLSVYQETIFKLCTFSNHTLKLLNSFKYCVFQVAFTYVFQLILTVLFKIF